MLTTLQADGAKWLASTAWAGIIVIAADRHMGAVPHVYVQAYGPLPPTTFKSKTKPPKTCRVDRCVYEVRVA